MNEVLQCGASYVMGKIDAEKTPPTEPFMIEDVEGSAAPAKK